MYNIYNYLDNKV